MNCSKCGASNKDAAVFCGKCGEKLNTEAEADYKAVDARPKGGKKGLFISITAAVVVIAALAVVLFVFVAPGSGNSTVDIRREIAVQSTFSGDGGWIYYSSSADGYSLYKISTYSNENTKLSSEASDCINLDEGWVYYRVFSGDDKNSICRMRKNGTNQEVIKEGVNVSRMLLFDKWLFYTAASPDAPDDGGYLYRMRTDGTEEIRLDVQPLEDAFGIIGKWIYYIDSADSCCYKMQLDGSKKTKLEKDCSGLALSYDGVYFNDDGRLSKMSLDGTEKEKLTDDLARNIIASNEWIYYINKSDGDSIYRVKKDGTERTKLNGNSVLLFSAAEFLGYVDAENWIYYVNKNDGEMYRMKTDGSENQRAE